MKMICFCKNEMKKRIINSINYYECNNCNYLLKVDRVSQIEEKKRYDMHICDDGYSKYMTKVFLNIKKYLNDGISLDYGCGQIHLLSDILNNNNFKCYYYDLYYYNNLPNLKFDNIILIEVFEHIEDIYSLLKNLRSMLNYNGKIIIMTQVRQNNLEKWWYLRDVTHISFVDLKTMEVLSELLDFNLEYDSDNSIFVLSSI